MAPVGLKWLIPTLSQSNRSRSTRILISSGMAKEGCVSLSWMATCGRGGASQDGFQTKGYCECSLPLQNPQKASSVAGLGPGMVAAGAVSVSLVPEDPELSNPSPHTLPASTHL